MKIRSSELYGRARIDEVERAIVVMERNGFFLDSDFCNTAAGKARGEEEEVLYNLDAWLKNLGHDSFARGGAEEINWASPTQVVELLHDVLKLPPSPVWKKGRVKLDKGDRKLDEAALDWVGRKSEPKYLTGINQLIRLRRVRGAIKYLTKLPTFVAPDGRVHPVSGPSSDRDDRAGTITWRLASKNPEVMQIPTNAAKDWYRIRRAFVAPPGHVLLCADETALEAVIFAHILIELFDDHQLADLLQPGVDLHAINAKRVFGEYLKWERYGHRVDSFPDAAFKNDADYPELCSLRNDIKAIWYGLMYGKGAYGFATSLRDANDNPIGMEAAEAIVSALYTAVPGIPRYQGFVLDYITHHHGIPGLGGAWVDLSELTKTRDKWDLARAHRIAQNYPMQEGGARIIGAAMCDILRDPYLTAQGLLLERQVHDELDFRLPLVADIDGVKAGIRRHMTSYPLKSLLQVSIGMGQTWDDC